MVRETRRAPLPPAREVPKSSSVACDPFTTENMLPARNRSSFKADERTFANLRLLTSQSARSVGEVFFLRRR
jgi:hypothetical protein